MAPFENDDRATSPTWLYRYYDADGDLLYVGITNEPHTRRCRHLTSQWMQYAVAAFYECFPMRRLAEAAEEMAIAIEGPEFNSVRRHRASVSAHDCDWYFDLTSDALIGQGQFWTTPTCAGLSPIDCPDGISAPDHIMPVITNRNRALN